MPAQPESPVERRLRAQVAACTRLLHSDGILDYSGHVSARLPDRQGFLIQSIDTPRGDVAPEDLLVVDGTGRRIDGPPGFQPPAEVQIHCAILRARSDVGAIVHFHPPVATLFTLVEGSPLRPVKNHAARWASGIPVHPDPGHVDSPDRGASLAATLGPHHGALIRAHGAVVVAESVPALLVDAVHFEENARALHQALQIGPVAPLTDREMADFLERFDRQRHVEKLWRYYRARGASEGLIPAQWDCG